MKAGDVVESVEFIAYTFIEKSSITILYAPQIFYNKSYENGEETRDDVAFSVAPFRILECMSDWVKPHSLLCGRECAPESDNGTLKEREKDKGNEN